MTVERDWLRRARELHEHCIVVDTHHDIALDLAVRRRLGEKGTLQKRWLPRLREAGIKVQVFPVYVEEDYAPELTLRRAVQVLDALLLELEEAHRDFAICCTGADIDAALDSGRIAAVLAVEGLDFIHGDLSVLRMLWRQGVRMVGLTWNARNYLADGAGEGETGGGLTRLGRELVAELGRLGMILDLSHLSDAGVRDALAVARCPVIASHSNARCVCDHPRNLTDDQIRAIAARDGVIGLLMHPGVVGPDQADLDGVLRHYEHMRRLVGPDHVGLGVDLLHDLPVSGHSAASWLLPADVALQRIAGLGRIEELPNLTAAMLAAGYPEEDVVKFLGANFLRVLRRMGQPALGGTAA